MDPILASYANLYAVNSFLVNKALDGLSDEQVWTRPGDRSNSIGWILGHLTWARLGLLRMLGGENVPVPGGKIFERGAELADRSAYPATADLVAALREITARLKARMEAVDDATLSAPSPRDFPTPDKSVRGAVAFLCFHESYHVGQIAYVVKFLGKDGLVG
jgi:uncharacterized damage-inducible protein DinB